MTDLHTAPVYDEPSPRLLHSLFFIEQVCLAFTVQLAAIALSAWIFPATQSMLPTELQHISPEKALSALLCSICFFVTEPRRSARLRLLGWMCAAGTLFLSANSIFLGDRFLPSGLAHPLPALASGEKLHLLHGGAPIRSAILLALIALIAMLARVAGTTANRAADLLKLAALLLFLNLFWEFSLSLTGSLATDGRRPIELDLLVCLGLLTFVALLRESALPIFRIYLGSSIGSRVARWLLPIFFALQWIREVIRASAALHPVFSTFYVVPVLSTIASLVMLLLVLTLTLRINRMERSIRDLTLRDGLTGLYNVKGFHLLAESALLNSRRASLPFAVLFIDLDRLKQINDTHGHYVGTAALTETAKLLANTFRENDIVGRIGGDEFAVAGQFDELTLHSAINRLRAVMASRSPELQRRFPLSFSIGFAVAAPESTESLRELISRADVAMYQDKSTSRAAHQTV